MSEEKPTAAIGSKDGSTTSSIASVSKSHEQPSAVNAKALEAKDVAVLADEKSEFPVSRDEEDVVDEVPPGAQSPVDEYEYPTKWKLVLITTALCLSVFCMALDNTIIATAIPKITDQFQALDDIGWFVSVYLLTTCGFQLIYGKIYKFYSIKWTYMAALLVFEIGSLICAVAPNATALILGRAVAGLGSAGIFTGAILIVSYTVPLTSRPIYMGVSSLI
jgi:Major Facilitator Superfamily